MTEGKPVDPMFVRDTTRFDALFQRTFPAGTVDALAYAW